MDTRRELAALRTIDGGTPGGQEDGQAVLVGGELLQL
jgi:hypothetical protein